MMGKKERMDIGLVGSSALVDLLNVEVNLFKQVFGF